MLLPRRSSTLLKLFFVCACLLGTGTRAQEETVGPTAAAAGVVHADTVRAIELYKQGSHAQAADILRRAVKQRKTDAQAWLHLGIALSRAGKSKDARKAFEQTLKLSPHTPQAHIGMAYIYMDENKPAEAEQHAVRAVSIAPRNAEAHYALGLIALRQGSAAKALAEADTTLRLNPDFVGALILKTEATVEVYTAANAQKVAKYRMLKQPTPPLTPEERAESGKMLREAAESVEKYLRLSPASPAAARLREQAEALRWHAEVLAESDAPFAYAADAVTTKAQIVSKPEPLYTDEARNNGISGTVRLRMLLAFDGRVRHISVLQGLAGGLTEMAVNAARKIKFTPATKDGRPVSQFVTIEYNFHIF
ncbi:MAG TPA: TonB family protein [Pyrinomonadaceae bacterium]|nr:TonB family protein [Pyrinomonadaceae bacterium]